MQVPQEIIKTSVALALAEDLNNQPDITAQLIPEQTQASAQIIAKENAILCGVMWVNEVFAQLSPHIKVDWKHQDGDKINAKDLICVLKGPARALVTGERTALNFLQLLSGTASQTNALVSLIIDSETKLLDTRKTIPGLRLAQKYAVHCGGGQNHRIGLYDAFLIKENHIAACGSITTAIESAKKIAPGKKVEVEVRSLSELEEGLEALPDIIMLDNFTEQEIRKAVAITKKQAKLEISGNITAQNIKNYAGLGVDYISAGALTKNVKAIDFTMLFDT